jgi:uncharacterized membrane protein
MTTLDSGISRNRIQSPINKREEEARHINVGKAERTAAGVAGAGLIALALTQRTVNTGLLGLLGGALAYRAARGHCPMYHALGINTARTETAQPRDYNREGIHVEVSHTIDRPPKELYAFWRNFENLPRFMNHLKSVRVNDEKRSHWVATGPAGYDVEWDAEIINEEQDRSIAWRSLAGADVDNSGSVRFIAAPGNRGTEVKVVLDYIPPAGKIGSVIAKLFGEEPEGQIREDLRRFKRLMETGEIITVEGQTRGSRCLGL